MTLTRSRRKLLQNSVLYAILDADVLEHRALPEKALSFLRAKINIVQLRDKSSFKKEILKKAGNIARALKKSGTLFIVNDHIDIALLTGCDGVHLGQDDIPIQEARKLMGNKKLIGVSCHSLEQALKAQKSGADYIGVGPVFKTPTKPEYKAVGIDLISHCAKRIKIPFFVIGGIDLSNVNTVAEAGATRIAVCRELCLSRNIKITTKRFKSLLEAQKSKFK